MFVERTLYQAPRTWWEEGSLGLDLWECILLVGLSSQRARKSHGDSKHVKKMKQGDEGSARTWQGGAYVVVQENLPVQGAVTCGLPARVWQDFPDGPVVRASTAWGAQFNPCLGS